jgi:hypothetical protein
VPPTHTVLSVAIPMSRHQNHSEPAALQVDLVRHTATTTPSPKHKHTYKAFFPSFPPFQTQTLLSKSARTLASLNRTNVHLRASRDVFSPKTNPVVCGLTRYPCSIHSSHSQIDPPR